MSEFVHICTKHKETEGEINSNYRYITLGIEPEKHIDHQ